MLEETIDYKLPQSPAERKEFQESINMVKASFNRIDDERESINEDIKAISEKFELPKSKIRKLCIDLAKGSFSKRLKENDAYNELYQEYTSIIDVQKPEPEPEQSIS